MKKIFFAICIALTVATISAPANASGGNNSTEVSVPSSKIPPSVLSQLAKMYPGATQVQWSILPPAYYGTTIYQAKFKYNGSKMKVNFL